MDKIVGYYDYYDDKYEYTRYGREKVSIRVDRQANDIEKFFMTDKDCPFCKKKLKLVFSGMRSEPRGGDLFFSGDVLECQNCGWWTYKTHFVDEVDGLNEVMAVCTDERYYAITKSFDIDDKFLPIEVLNAELKKKPDILYKINPYKLEQLSQSILKDVYDCEVHHVGKRGDGGKDLIVLESDNPILVQVKCRQNPKHVELVQGIREFIGTLYIEDAKKGIYISTAKRFSEGSVDVVERLIENRKLDFFELINYDKLQALIKNTEEKKVWKDLVGYFYEHDDAAVYDTDDAIKEYLNGCKEYEKLLGLTGCNNT